eukprot:TRINITY_DN12263_c0_g1_i1.p1 TRINITY_DN12263_c0_g1~~TRINITY_DN12263_c0_g1_i1.p1  ORF type:complete len:666 (+),score=140.38 TRINITY_DN12263_c0_g1_i1:45-2000(+)
MLDKIKVLLRVRPFENEEAVFKWTDQRISPMVYRQGVNKDGFLFQKVLGPESSNTACFSEIVDTIPSVFEGINTTVLAYGHTSAGKTHTMLGTPQKPGLILQSLDMIISSMTGNDVITVSYFEIYMEKVFDLLSKEKNELDVTEDGVNGLISCKVSSLEECHSILSTGQDNRRRARTNLNEHSSRSHTIFQVDVTSATEKNKLRRAQLRLVDLAGSENSKMAGTTGESQREGGNINKSLLALTNVIHRLASKSSYIPFRDSKLTRILQNSLGGNSVTRIVCCVAPTKQFFDEAMTTLHFADRARVIQNAVTINEVDGSKTVPWEALQEVIRMYQNELDVAESREQAAIQHQQKEMELVIGHLNAEHDAESSLLIELDYINQKKLHAAIEACQEAKLVKSKAERDRARYQENAKSFEKKLQVKDECITELNKNKAMLNELVARQEEELKKVTADNEALQEEMEKENQIRYEQQKLQQQQQQNAANAFSLTPSEMRTKLTVHGKQLDTFKKRMNGLRKLHDVMCDDMFSSITAPPPSTDPNIGIAKLDAVMKENYPPRKPLQPQPLNSTLRSVTPKDPACASGQVRTPTNSLTKSRSFRTPISTTKRTIHTRGDTPTAINRVPANLHTPSSLKKSLFSATKKRKKSTPLQTTQ